MSKRKVENTRYATTRDLIQEILYPSGEQPQPPPGSRDHLIAVLDENFTHVGLRCLVLYRRLRERQQKTRWTKGGE